MRVLLAFDEAASLKRTLQREGFAVDTAPDAVAAATKARAADYCVIVLDLTSFQQRGVAIVADWRRHEIQSHMVVLCGSESPDSKADLLNAGADDCLAAPFSVVELLARVRALVRRNHQVKDPVLRVFDLEIDTVSRNVRRGGRSIHLTPTEFALLQLLAMRRGAVVSRSLIFEQLYNEHEEATSNVVDVYIRYLRTKIDKGFDVPLILTRWGQGYLLRAELDAVSAKC